MERLALIFAGLSGALAVGFGAFGAHALKGRLAPELATVFDTAAHYHLVHSVAILAAAWLGARADAGLGPKVAIWAFFLGTVLFSGSLYAMALSGVRALGAITPVGGTAFIIGWGALAWAGFRMTN